MKRKRGGAALVVQGWGWYDVILDVVRCKICEAFDPYGLQSEQP